MSSWHSPQSIYNLGHAAIKDLFTVPVQIQEKVDGSFFAFGLYNDPQLIEFDVDGDRMELKIRSKGAVMVTDAPQALFKLAVDAVKIRRHELHPGWMYRGETLAKPKHNALAYDRVPKDNIILFDILTEEEEYLPYSELAKEASRIGLEVVPQLASGVISSAEELRKYLETVSVLGGQKVEGVVIKPLTPLYGPDKKMLFGKFVSEAYKEVHSHAWKENNPTNKDIVSMLGDVYGTQARWNKAIQHAREQGLLEDSPKDIGILMHSVPLDVLKECEDEIKQRLFKHAWPHVSRMITRGLPEYYKNLLLTKQFETEPEDQAAIDAENEGMIYGQE